MDSGTHHERLLTAVNESQPSSSSVSFSPDDKDIGETEGPNEFFRKFYVESKKLWYLAAPAIFISLCQYSLGAVTQLFAGHISTIALAAVSVEISVISNFSFGILLGMGSALETLCGQAFGAGQIEMLGIYMQRSWVILNATALILTPFYVFATPILKLLGQTTEISEAAGTFAIYIIPELYAYAFVFPVNKFLQAQSKMMVMAVIAAAVLVLHTFLSWLLMLKLQMGLVGAALVLNGSWVVMTVAQILYVLSGTCGLAWSGFSRRAFQNLFGFVKLSLESAVMICLEVWYFMALILFAGYLKNPEISVDALAICMNIIGWTIMIAFGFNAAISVRISNELGADHPGTAKFSVLVVVVQALCAGLVPSLVLTVTQNDYPSWFANSIQVQELVRKLTPLLAISIITNMIQPALSGVAIGAGWQGLVAYVNVACYYLFGIPVGLILGYLCDMGVQGIWLGMMSGILVQTSILLIFVYRTNWTKEASIAGDRIKKWGGEPIERDFRVL